MLLRIQLRCDVAQWLVANNWTPDDILAIHAIYRRFCDPIDPVEFPGSRPPG